MYIPYDLLMHLKIRFGKEHYFPSKCLLRSHWIYRSSNLNVCQKITLLYYHRKNPFIRFKIFDFQTEHFVCILNWVQKMTSNQYVNNTKEIICTSTNNTYENCCIFSYQCRLLMQLRSFLINLYEIFDYITLFMHAEEHRGLAGLQREDYEPSIAESNVRSVISQSPYQNLVKQFKEYIPQSEIIDLNQLKTSPNLKLKKYRQAAYYGEIVNGRRHGSGIMIYNNDRVYEGHWECDYKQGNGYQLFPNGSIYQGEYVNGKPEGVGKYTWPNGQSYEGEWVNGLKHGSGMWRGVKGDSYVGQWRMGKAQGYGVHVWINGDRYEGNFKACLKHGQGTQKFANGDLYKGQYARGKPNGYGQYYWANSSYFKGGFRDGLREGHGMWKKGAGNSDKYEGQYLQDKKHGYGIFTWASGNVYKGNYKQDLRSGFGEMYWSDGSYYKGEWLNGIQHGQGMIFVPQQGTKKGLFRDNTLVQIYEEQHLPAPNMRVGTIHKNLPSQLQAIQEKEHYKSMDGRRKVNTTFDHRNNNLKVSREQKISHLPPKPQGLRPMAYKSTHTAQIQRTSKKPNGFELPKKQRIPHSAYYMHKLHKRVNTAQNQSQAGGRSRGQIVEQLKNFTRKMVGRPSRLSSTQK